MGLFYLLNSGIVRNLDPHCVQHLNLQWGLEIRTWNTKHHSNTERFKVQFSISVNSLQLQLFDLDNY